MQKWNMRFRLQCEMNHIPYRVGMEEFMESDPQKEKNSSLQVLCLLQWYNCELQSSAMLPRVASYVLPDVSKEHVFFIITIRLKVLEPFERSGTTQSATQCLITADRNPTL